jgi:hypothetical protein
MEEQIPASNFPPASQGLVGQITPEQLSELKERARLAAMMQVYQQQQAQPIPPGRPLEQVVYVKRPLTVAEIILMLALSCGIVFGTQFAVNFITNTLPRIEIKMK